MHKHMLVTLFKSYRPLGIKSLKILQRGLQGSGCGAKPERADSTAGRMAGLTSTQACRGSRDWSFCRSMVSSSGWCQAAQTKSAQSTATLHPACPYNWALSKNPSAPPLMFKHHLLPSTKMCSSNQSFTGSWEPHKHPAHKEHLNITHFTGLSRPQASTSSQGQKTLTKQMKLRTQPQPSWD